VTREQRLFVASVGGLWLLFVVQAYLTPVVLDDWYQLTWHRHHAFGLSSILAYAHYNYFNYNPRIGDVFLLCVNGPRVIHLVATPLVEVLCLWCTFAIAFARWPRPTLRDLQLLLFIQVMIWLVVPVPGLIYFYRPFTTNYLYAFTITMLLFVPFRLELARATAGKPKHWLIPIMLVAGWAAGMCNEHTGPTAMAVIACLVCYAWRRRRLRPWMIAALVGLYIGYPMLFFAPGQSLRYGGVATKESPLALIAQRGITGNWQIILDFVGEAQLAIDLVVVALLVYVIAIRKRGEAIGALGRSRTFTIAGLICVAGAIIVTMFASPVVGERLFFAPGLLFVGALALVIDHIFSERAVRRFMTITCAVIFGYHAFRFVQVYVIAHLQNDARLAVLRAAAPNTTAYVKPYPNYNHSRWAWGDDFQYASLREYVANEVFDLNGIEYDRVLHWAEPSPPDKFVATRTYDPPLPPDEAARVAPVRYIPTYWEWAVVQMRKLMALTELSDYHGHELVHYTVDVANPASEFVDPKHRPFRVVDWTPARVRFLDGRPYDDDYGRPYIRIRKSTVPEHLTDSYVLGCGKTWKVTPQPDDEGVGPILPLTLECRGTYTGVMCEDDLCWLGGRYWR
jgi:hypothetical protein